MKPKRRPPQKVVNHEKRRKRMVLVFGIFMIFLMVFSVVSVINTSPSGSNRFDYGDIEFALENRPNGGSVLIAELNGQPVEFQNLPTQVGYLEMDPSIIPILRTASVVAMTADPSLELYDLGFIDYIRLQIGVAFGKAYTAMTAENDYNLPVVTCANASYEQPVLQFNLTNETAEITESNYCITIHGRDQGLMRAKDRLIFEYYGILQNGEVIV
ncbi:MAG: hypothetical protein OXR66_09455 [Candidatus Woesearchaeota archaeon]|nr:hypothetical protein [Candidatus Woesearchaeota archaeon]